MRDEKAVLLGFVAGVVAFLGLLFCLLATLEPVAR